MRETKKQLQDRRRQEFHRILSEYRENNGKIIAFFDLTPYCIRVTKRIQRTGRERATLSELGSSEVKPIFTGAEIGIIDLYPTSLRCHNLRKNWRGTIYGNWETTITKMLNEILGI